MYEFLKPLGRPDPRKLSRKSLHKVITNDDEYLTLIGYALKIRFAEYQGPTHPVSDALGGQEIREIERKELVEVPELVKLCKSVFPSEIADTEHFEDIALHPDRFDSSYYLHFISMRDQNKTLYKEAKKTLQKHGGDYRFLIKRMKRRIAFEQQP